MNELIVLAFSTQIIAINEIGIMKPSMIQYVNRPSTILSSYKLSIGNNPLSINAKNI